MRVRFRHHERGASLIIVLAMVTTFGLIAGGFAAQGQAGVLSAAGARAQRVNQYAATGALNGAIAALRGDVVKGREGAACPNYRDPTDRVVVTCTPQSGSGERSTTTVNVPTQALLTTRGLPGYGTGVGLTVTGNNPLLINGPVYSNSSINVTKLNVPGYSVGAFGACTGTITSTPAATCNTGTTVADPGGNSTTDPGPGSPWASSIQTMPAKAAAPVCSSTSKVATMEPGAYFSVSELTAGIGSCATTYMKPGGYYFDFEVTSASNPVWTIANTTIGGTAKGWNPNGVNQAPVVPGACHTNDPNNPAGVEMMFAGASRIDVSGTGALEVCPTLNDAGHEIVLSGRKTTSAATPVTATLSSTGATSASPAGMGTPLANILAIDGITNSAVTLAGKNAAGKVTLTGYDLSAIPYGAKITSVQVIMAHGENGQVGTFGVAATAGTTNLCTSTGTGWNASFALATDSVTCTPNLTWTGTAATAQLAYTVTRPNNSSSTDVRLDGAQLVVTYTPPALRPTTLGTKIVSVSPGSSNKGQSYLWGTVYAPFAGADIDFKNNNETSFGRGVVLGFFIAKGVPPSQTFPPIDLPTGGGTYANRDVVLVATLNGQTWVKARVEYDDQGGTAPGHTVIVKSWTSQR